MDWGKEFEACLARLKAMGNDELRQWEYRALDRGARLSQREFQADLDEYRHEMERGGRTIGE